MHLETPQWPAEDAHTGAARRLVLFVGTLALLLGAVAAFVRIYDPYARFGGTSKAARVFGSAANGPLLTELQLRSVPTQALAAAEIVILGDSRGRRLTADRCATVRGRQVLNLASGGASLEESLSLLQERADRLKSLRLLIIAAPLERFAELPTPDRCREAALLANSTLRYLLNWQMCKDAWIIRNTPATSPKLTWDKDHLTPAQQAERDAAAVRAWRKMYASYNPEVSTTRLSVVERAMAPFLARKVKVVFWQPPVKDEISRMISEFQLDDVARGIRTRLGRVAPVLDLTRETSLRGHTLAFDDPVHTATDSQVLLETLMDAGG